MAKVLVNLKKPLRCPICKKVLYFVEPIPTICCDGFDFRCPYCRCILPVGYKDVELSVRELEKLFD